MPCALKHGRRAAIKTKVTFSLRRICQGNSLFPLGLLLFPIASLIYVEALVWDCAIYWLPSVLIMSAGTASSELWVAFSCSRLCDSCSPPSLPPPCCINNCKSGFISGYRGRLETNSSFLRLRTETLWFVSCFHFLWNKRAYFLMYTLGIAADLVEIKTFMMSRRTYWGFCCWVNVHLIT